MKFTDKLGIFLGGWLVGMIFCLIVCGKSYKDGQVDAVTGKMQYQLVVHSDSTKTWERIMEVKK